MQKTAVLGQGQRQGVILAATKQQKSREDVTKNAYDYRIALVSAEVGGKN